MAIFSVIFAALLTMASLSLSSAEVVFQGDGTDPDENNISRLTALPIDDIRGPYRRGYGTRWDTMPDMALLRRQMSTRGASLRARDKVPEYKRSSEASPDDTGLTLSIMSPLDVLREKMLLTIANRKFQMKSRLASNNALYLRTYG